MSEYTRTLTFKITGMKIVCVFKDYEWELPTAGCNVDEVAHMILGCFTVPENAKLSKWVRSELQKLPSPELEALYASAAKLLNQPLPSAAQTEPQ